MTNGITDQNILLKQINYFDIVYETMFNYIHKSKFVMTSCPEWALICNKQKIPLLYWGDDASMFKPDGIYGFNNTNSISIKSISKIMIQSMYDKMSEDK